MDVSVRGSADNTANRAAGPRAPIATLPTEVIERIAAGEVIERPLSVVRELVDNALDAGATTIRVELRDGGLRLIRVSDDGCGMDADDLVRACQPHSTSKIAHVEDLTSLTTLGFRGEALASIALVADIEIVTATADSAAATGISLFPGDPRPNQWLTARAAGTTVTVRRLFHAVPARQALLAAPGIERSRCFAAMVAYACAHPAIQFTVVADGEMVMRTPGTDLRGALLALYGADVAAAMLPFAVSSAAEATIEGCVSARQFTQTSRDGILITVNGRIVNNRALLAAAEAGYRSLLRKGRHPVLVARVTVPPGWVDFNVHPTKAEVLLRDERNLCRALRDAVHEALGSAPTAVDPTLPTSTRFRPQPPLRFPATRGGRRAPRIAPPRRGVYMAAGVSGVEPPLTALAQLNDALILARGGTGYLYLVDQHRAHERLLYDQLRQELARTRGFESSPVAGSQADGDAPSPIVHDYMKDQDDGVVRPPQLLLEPYLIELSSQQALHIASRLHELAVLGLQLQPFGGKTFLVRSVPALPGAAQSLAASVREVALDAAADSNDWLDHLCASLACRAAIRRGQSLTVAEQQALLTDLESASAPAICPHGSPLILGYAPELLSDLFEW